jgi:hypothetical protein
MDGIGIDAASGGGLMPRRIVIAGSLGQRPGNGGHTWVFLQYLLGFRRLGFEVLFLDRIEPGMCTDRAGNAATLEESFNLAYFEQTMERFGLIESCALFHDAGRQSVGRSREEVLRFVDGSELLLNVMGFFNDAEILASARLRVFLDIDPGFPQMWKDLGLADMFAGHDAYVTIGENIGDPSCVIPTCGIDWITTPQPVVLEHWPIAEGGEAFSSIASWRGPFGPIEYRGKTYGLRAHEFRKFIELPKRAKQFFQVAMDIHAAEVKDITALDANGWSLVSPADAARDPQTYQRFIQQSLAELMIAKNMYVATAGGWFSDRSICYLASGKPVLAQETGFSRHYPTGEGLLSFSTMDEAIDGVERIAREPAKHQLAARRIAEEHFNSDKVLTNLIAKLGVKS